MKKKFNISELINAGYRLRLLMICSLVFLVCIVGCGFPSISSPVPKENIEKNGHFEKAGKLIIPRCYNTVTLLKDGRVLITGGIHSGKDLSSAEIYDPKTKRFTLTGNMNTARYNHRATLLNDGRVLITGGNMFHIGRLYNAEIYDPNTGKFAKTGDMLWPRVEHATTLLKDGRVLILGGDLGGQSTELFDPAKNEFIQSGVTKIRRQGRSSAILLNDGRVLIIGGDAIPGAASSKAELYDPNTNKFILLPYATDTEKDAPALASLRDGRILIVGGQRGYNSDKTIPIVEIFDPNTYKFEKISGLNVFRRAPSAVLLKDGKVLILGGTFHSAKAEIYDPATNKFTLVDKKLQSLFIPTTPLNNGEILILDDRNLSGENRRVEIFKY